jgi:hypothetical protein
LKHHLSYSASQDFYTSFKNFQTAITVAMKIPTIFTVAAGIVVTVNASPKPKPAPDKMTTPQQAAEIYIYSDSECTVVVGGVHIKAGDCYVIAQPSFTIISVDEVVGDAGTNCAGDYILRKPNEGDQMLTIRSEQPYGLRLL